MNGTRADLPIPSQSIAYTDDRLDAAHSPSAEKFLKKNPSPAPYPCKRTAGAGEELHGEVEVMDRVLMCRFWSRTILELYATTGWSDTSERECGGSER
jgi:hypothetical protein